MPLTADRLRELVAYDAQTGVFTWRKRNGGDTAAGSVLGTIRKDGYLEAQIDGYAYLLHRVAWLYVHGEWPKNLIDHEDTIKHHNWISNLRAATRGQNMQNQRKAHANNIAGLLGVSRSRSGWRAKIQIDGKIINLGTFKDPNAAHSAYLGAKKSLHPFGTLNGDQA